MAFTLSCLADLARLPFDAVIDVRSPSEYAEDHIPGAQSLPVLDDAERARVGTIYVRESRFRARRLGAALIARNAAAHLEGPLADRPAAWRPLVYCWRGGQRSGAFAHILREVGWRAETLEGGWRSYRRLVQRALYAEPFPAPVVLIDGNTGTAKTEVLGLLPALGVAAIDLEALANHRGSMFGARPGGQPSQKAFESGIAALLARLDPGRPVAVEAESARIGERVVPPALWRAMQAAPRVEIAAPAPARAAYLVRTYGDVLADPARLDRVLTLLAPFHPRERIGRWRGLAAEGAHPVLAAELIADHYDPRYVRERARGGPVAARIEADDLSPAAIPGLAARVADAVRRVAGADG
jgi:tRNA 2-selenouridine synthase